MALRPQTFTKGALVDKHINTAYDTVKAVSGYLSEIALLAASTTLANINLVGGSVADVNTVAADITAGKLTAAIAAAASTASDLLATNADVVLTGADVGYSQEWATAVEDLLVSTAAGGDGTTDYSALHHAAKALANSVLTASDVVSTNADVVSTGADATATAADVVQTGLDSAQTISDAAATANDVISTGTDATNTAADAASTLLDVGYSQEWAVNPEDTLVSNAAGGDGVTDYSSLHHAAKAASAAANSVAKTSDTGAAVMPKGTTLERPGTPVTGYLRFNTDYGRAEEWDGTSWKGLGGANGAGGDSVFYENDQSVDNNYTITTGKNAVTAGPVTVNAIVTIPTGSRWTVV